MFPLLLLLPVFSFYNLDIACRSVGSVTMGRKHKNANLCAPFQTESIILHPGAGGLTNVVKLQLWADSLDVITTPGHFHSRSPHTFNLSFFRGLLHTKHCFVFTNCPGLLPDPDFGVTPKQPASTASLECLSVCRTRGRFCRVANISVVLVTYLDLFTLRNQSRSNKLCIITWGLVSVIMPLIGSSH